MFTVNGHRRYSRDLEQGRLEIPCEYSIHSLAKTRTMTYGQEKRKLEELKNSLWYITIQMVKIMMAMLYT